MASTFNLGERYDRLLDDMVASGDYANKSEVMRDALRLLERDRVQWSEVIEGHRAALADETPLLSRDEAFGRIRSRFAKTGDRHERDTETNRSRNSKS